MRTIFPFLYTILLFSCNSSDTTNNSGSTISDKQQNNRSVASSQRQLLIEELERMQIVFASGDKERIADIFPFPLPDTSLGIYIDDDNYYHQFEKNGNKTTRAMFIDFFPQLYENLQMDELNQLFRQIRLDSLLKNDTLEHEVHIKTEPCYKYYKMIVEQDVVILSTGSGANRSYQSSSSSKDDMPKNSSEFCESILWWVFRFDGKKLHFIKLQGAG